MHAERRFVAAVLRAGACGYLLKNAAVEELVRAIRTVAGGRPYLSPSIAGSVLEAFRDEEQDTPLSLLTGREREVLQLLAEGHPSRAIAERLSVSIKTVGTHREHLMEKLGAHSVAELTKLAIREGVTSVDG
jgi:DNA-binding NarL/FixJ family response regulator